MRKFEKQEYLVAATFAVLVLLVIIQVTWIINAVRLENQNFNHNVVLALNGAKNDISQRIHSNRDMKNYLCGKTCPNAIRAQKVKEVDSIIYANLQDFGIPLEYQFSITDSTPQKSKVSCSQCYTKSLNGLLEQNGIHIRLNFPGRSRFIAARMTGMFVISVILIVFVMVSFLITLRLYRKEKSLSLRIMDFVNNMVHEFQTPLSNIGFATSLIRKKPLNYFNILT